MVAPKWLLQYSVGCWRSSWRLREYFSHTIRSAPTALMGLLRSTPAQSLAHNQGDPCGLWGLEELIECGSRLCLYSCPIQGPIHPLTHPLLSTCKPLKASAPWVMVYSNSWCSSFSSHQHKGPVSTQAGLSATSTSLWLLQHVLQHIAVASAQAAQKWEVMPSPGRRLSWPNSAKRCPGVMHHVLGWCSSTNQCSESPAFHLCYILSVPCIYFKLSLRRWERSSSVHY